MAYYVPQQLLGHLKRQIIKRRSRRAKNFWARAALRADTLGLGELALIDGYARLSQRHLHHFRRTALDRLGGALIGEQMIDTPPQCDWAWRPDAWHVPLFPLGQSGIASGTWINEQLNLHHDCPLSEATLRQRANTESGSQAPFGVLIDVLGFEGSFLSLTLNLPDGAVQSTTRSHIIRLAAHMTLEREMTAHARLNLKHGPNVEAITRPLDLSTGPVVCEFDLGHSKINAERLEKIWLDVIFDDPSMSHVVIADLTLMRRPRADV